MINTSQKLNEQATDLSIDVLNTGLQDVLKNFGCDDVSFLSDIPIVKWISTTYKMVNTISMRFFMEKYQTFLCVIDKNVSLNDVQVKKAELFTNTNTLNKFIEANIIELDRYQTHQKAEWLGRLFVHTFKFFHFDIDEYNTLLYSIDIIHPTEGEKCLKSFYEYDFERESKQSENEKRKVWQKYVHLDYSPLTNSCLLNLPKGGAYCGDLGGAYINDLGKRFYKYIILEDK
jgi:hypothetical protein